MLRPKNPKLTQKQTTGGRLAGCTLNLIDPERGERGERLAVIEEKTEPRSSGRVYFATCAAHVGILLAFLIFGDKPPWQPLTSRLARYPPAADAQCARVGTLPVYVIVSLMLTIAIADDTVDRLLRASRGPVAAPSLRHAACALVACSLCGETNAFTLILTCAAASALASAQSAWTASLWLAAWAVPVSAIAEGASAGGALWPLGAALLLLITLGTAILTQSCIPTIAAEAIALAALSRSAISVHLFAQC